MAIPIGPVPISLTNLAIYLSLYLLGWKWGTASYVVYMLIGMVGVPVFSGFTGGLGKLAGPTGGYIIGFVPMAVLAGLVIDRSRAGRSSSWGWPRPRGVLRLPERRGSASPWTAPCPPPWACVCSPSFRGCGQNAAGHDLRADAPEGWSGPGCTGADRSGEGRPALSPKDLFRRKRLDKRGQGAYNDTNKSMRRKPWKEE